MTEPSSTNPGPSKNVDWSGSMPKVDPIAHRQEDQTLRDQAHACGVFFAALLENGVPFHLAESIVSEFASDTLQVDGGDDD